MDIDSEIRLCLRGLLFRLHLVFRIMERTAAVVERQELIHIAMTAHLCLTLEIGAKRPTLTLPTIRDLVMSQVTEMLALQEASERAEARYLAGASSLFPEGARQWDAVLNNMKYTAASADRLVELDGGQSIENERTIPTEAD